jgi:hypothetical protein
MKRLDESELSSEYKPNSESSIFVMPRDPSGPISVIEDLRCPVCGSAKVHGLKKGNGGYEVVSCETCDFPLAPDHPWADWGEWENISVRYRENIKPRWIPSLMWRLVRRWVPACWTDWTGWQEWEPDTDDIERWRD